MIDEYLFCEWDEPPALMGFELPYGEVLREIAELSPVLSGLGEGDPGEARHWELAQRLYLLAPALVNVSLNYRICVDKGLPLHKSRYFEVDSPERGSVAYPESIRRAAERLVEGAIGLARAVVRLDPSVPAMAARFGASLPEGLSEFVYTSIPDKYTWRGAEPRKIRSLARSVLAKGRPGLALGAAHGSLMAGLLLAECLACDLWFLRFSMFKRRDPEPIFCEGDKERIASYGEGSRVLVFDEDSASGTTLSILYAKVAAIAPGARSGSVIRHAGSAFNPDHVGKVWWD